ncbi:MAG: AMP-binding protein [Pseudomonadota bacterium]
MLNQLPISRLSGTMLPAITDPHAAMQLALQYQFESLQWWPAETLQAYQLKQFQHLLIHAASTVPYYQKLLVTNGLNLPENLTLEFLKTFPISTRKIIQEAGSEIESNTLPSDHGTAEFSKTSGSTGRPVRFARTALTRTLWLAFALRDHLWHSRDFSGKLCAIRWFSRGTAEAPNGAHDPNWGNIVSPIFTSGPSAALNVVATLPEQIDWLHKENPDYLVSFPSNLIALVQYAQAHKLTLPALKEIRTIGESLSDEARKIIAEAWQTKVVDIYTCEEAGYLALQCPETGDYHVQSENVILEIIDEHGEACPPGKIGQVLITTLHNFATPLIRYEIGDMAEFGPPCKCGRGLPVIRKIHGRKRNRLILPSGESIFPYLGEHGDITRLTGVKQFQFQCIQLSTDEIELKLVMERPLTETEQSKVAELMQRQLGHPFKVRFSFPVDIPRGPTGKFEDFISLIAN